MSPSPVAPEIAVGTAERRRFPRYRYTAPIVVRVGAGSEAAGITLEISECGMSALIGAPLSVGDRVELEPVGGGIAAAVV
jgi:hypothetical protein